MECEICSAKIEELYLKPIVVLQKEFHLCGTCQMRVLQYVKGNTTGSVVNICWGGNLGYSCWAAIRDFIRKYGIGEVLEYCTGLSTELFVNEGVHVTSLDFREYNSKIYQEHDWLNNERAEIVWCSSGLPEFTRTWDFVLVNGSPDQSRQIEHALRYASRFLMLHDPNIGEHFPNDDWVQIDSKIWERKTSLSTPLKTPEDRRFEMVEGNVIQCVTEAQCRAAIESNMVDTPQCHNLTDKMDDYSNVYSTAEMLACCEAPKEEPSKNKPASPSRFAFIVSACCKYIPELCACLNSLEHVGNKEDVYVLGYRLPRSFTNQFGKLSYNVNLYDIPEPEARQYGGESEILCRKRYWYAAGYGQNYDAICVLDADMYFARNVWQYFEIAAKTGFIMGAGLEQKRVYGHIEHHKVRGKHLLPEPRWNDKDICCAPMFVDMKKHGDIFRECWTIFSDGFPEDNFKAPDMESYNLLLLAKNMNDQVFLLPNYQWVGTNEKLLKPYTRVTTQSDGKLWTESGLEIYIVHGQYYKLRWRRNQLESRHNCAMGYLGCADKCDNMANGALNCLWEKFKFYLDGTIKVDSKVAYTPNGDPGERLI